MTTSARATLLWKLRLHLVDVALNKAPALADVPACPELDPGACFVGSSLTQAIQLGLARQVRSVMSCVGRAGPLHGLLCADSHNCLQLLQLLLLLLCRGCSAAPAAAACEAAWRGLVRLRHALARPCHDVRESKCSKCRFRAFQCPRWSGPPGCLGSNRIQGLASRPRSQGQIVPHS